MKRYIGKGPGESRAHEFLCLWSQDVPCSWHINTFTNQQALSTFSAQRFYLEFCYMGVIDQIIGQMTELNFQSLFLLWRLEVGQTFLTLILCA